MFDPTSEIGRAYLSYVENRARIWAEKYIDGREPDYRGDKVLRRYHFCNVWRELDRYSRWEIAQIRGRPLQEQLDIIVIGRFCLVPSTAAILLRTPIRDALVAHRDRCRASGVQWYNPAIMIHAKGDGSMDYIDHFISHRAEYVADRTRLVSDVKAARTGADLLALLRGRYYGIGPFREYEVATSLTYSEHLPWLDEDGLFHVGPGAVGGLSRVTGMMTTSREAFEQLRDDVRVALSKAKQFRWIPRDWQGSLVKRDQKFTLRTLEDTLCEFRKYAGAIDGQSRYRNYTKSSRRLYRHHEAFA